MKEITSYSLIAQGTFSEVNDAHAEALELGYRTHFEPRFRDSDGIVYGDLYAACPEWVDQYKKNGGLWY